jgi:O-antigen ligase
VSDPRSLHLHSRRSGLATALDAAAAARLETMCTGADRADEAPWDLLLLCVAGFILTSVGRVHQLFPALEMVRPAVITGILAIGTYLYDSQEERRAVHVWGSTTKLLAALLFWMLLSVPSALRPGNSFNLVFDNFVKTALMYLVIAGSVRSIRDVERLAFTYLTGAVLYAAVVITRFDIGTGDTWRLGHLYYYDANDFATFAVTAMPFALYFAHAARRRFVRLCAAAGLGVLLLGFVRSGSRGGFIALVIVATFIVLRYSAIAVRWRLSAVSLVALVLLAGASDQYWRQMSTIVSDTDYNQTQESGRLQIWSRGVGYMLDQPIFGVGPNNFQVAEGTLSPFAERQQFGIGVRWNAAHNSFIQVGAELGIPGLVLFVAMIGTAFATLHRSDGYERAFAEWRWDRSPLTPALTAALLGFLVGSFFLSLAYSEMLYTLIALAIGLHKVLARSRELSGIGSGLSAPGSGGRGQEMQGA